MEKIARKLEPVVPDSVRKWRFARHAADPGLREDLDRQLVRLAYKHLGDFRSKILLSLPRRSVVRGAIHLGTVYYDSPRWPAGISRGELLQHTAILGRSGSGKSNCCAHMLVQLARLQVPFVAFDWKRTTRDLAPLLSCSVRVVTAGRNVAPLIFNPFLPPPGLDSSVYGALLTDAIGDAYTLGDGARHLLSRALCVLYQDGPAPSLESVLEHIKLAKVDSRSGLWKTSLLRALESLAIARIGTVTAHDQSEYVRDIQSGATILELDALSEAAKQFLVPLICLWLYQVRLASRTREKLELAIVIEEAHNVFYRARRSRETLMEALLRQCRELGIAMILVDQSPHLLSSAALGNVYTSICLNQKDPSDVNKAASLSRLDEDEKHFLTALPIGTAIVKLQDRWTRPFLVRIPHVRVPKGSVTDRALQERSHLRGRFSLPRGSRESENASLEGSRNEDYCLSVNHLDFLLDIVRNPHDGVDKRYRRLRMSADRGNRLKNELMDAGYIEAQSVTVRRTRRTLLRLTSRARRLYADESTAPRRESLEHEYWKHWYASHYRAHGYHVEVEAQRKGGRLDILASRGAQHLAIEIETGKSSVLQNVKNCLQSGFTHVIVVATSEKAARRILQQLANARLIIPRVLLVVRDDGRAKERAADDA